MRNVPLATLASLLALTAPLPARAGTTGSATPALGSYLATAPLNASGPGYLGTCRVAAALDTTPGALFGGPTTWSGDVDVIVVATIPGDTITAASCWFKVNSGTESPLLVATTFGAVAAGAGQAGFAAAVTDTMYVCTHVTTVAAGFSDLCQAITTTPVCPPQLCGDGGVLDQAGERTRALDPYACPLLAAAAPAVDALPSAGLLYVDPTTGDTYVPGDPSDPHNLFWDCPPYVP